MHSTMYALGLTLFAALASVAHAASATGVDVTHVYASENDPWAGLTRGRSLLQVPRRRNPSPPPLASSTLAAAARTLRGARSISTIMGMINKAGLAAAFNDPATAVAAFLPSNAAVASFLKRMNVTAAQASQDVPTFLWMLSAHVLTEKYTSADLDQYALAPTLGADSYLYITRSGADVFVQAAYSRARVIVADVDAGNSVIHVVNSLLLPAAAGSAGNVYPSVDVALEMHATPRLSTMRAGMKQLGAAVGPALLDPSVSMTVFAPADSGFERAMAEFYSSDKADLSEADKVRSLYGLHVVLGQQLMATDAQMGVEYTFTTQNGDLLKVVKRADGIYLTGPTNTARAVQTDIRAGLSVVHVIDQALLPRWGGALAAARRARM